MLIFCDCAKTRVRSLTTTKIDNKVRATRKQLRFNMIIPQALIIDSPDGVVAGVVVVALIGYEIAFNISLAVDHEFVCDQRFSLFPFSKSH